MTLTGILAATARAQVNVEVKLDQEQYLRSESLPVLVRISNDSGRALRLGEDPDWLSFTINEESGKQVLRTGEVPQAKPFTIEPAKTVSLRTDLMPHFDLSQLGHYTLKLKMKVPQINEEISAKPQSFDIITGVTLWEKDVGVPRTDPLVTRKYALQQATFYKQQRLYVRVTDATGSRVIKVVSLGQSVAIGTPETKVDNVSHLHVLFRNNQQTFLYGIVTTDGDLIIRQTYEFAGSPPRLRAEPDGRVVVVGGQRKILLSDLPPSRVANTDEKLDQK
jgi:hypothetical protein